MSTPDQVDRTFRQERARVLAGLIRLTGDWDLAEDCLQDAFEKALQRWPAHGVPDRPGAWLTTTARHRALDVLRRAGVESVKLGEVARMNGSAGALDGEGSDARLDDRLSLIFTCCHPALPLEARVALTLRTVAGLSTEQLALAFLTSNATMGQRLSRAKAKIREAGIPYRVPPAELFPERLSGVLAVVYLLFNEGYSRRPELVPEALRLGRLLLRLMPVESEVRGLLALMVLQHSRAAARVDAAGDLVPLDEQDRTRWDRDLIEEGLGLLTGASGPYQVQAAVAACHARAGTADETDWARIATLYGELAALTSSPFVELNRAVAVAMSQGPQAGLELVSSLEASGALAGYHLLAATRADLLRRTGRRDEALLAYEQARELAPTVAEQRFLARRITETRG